MLFLKTVFTAIFTFLVAVSPFAQSELPEQKTAPSFNGTFLQSWMSCTWDEERWSDEVEVMQKDGIEYLIIQDVANFYSDGSSEVFYNSTVDALSDAYFAGDVIGNALEAVKGTDIKVFIGLAMYDNFWSTSTFGSEYLKVCDITAEMIEDIYGRYYADYKDNFYGWYFTMELNNILNCQPMTVRAVKGLNKVLEKASAVDASLPLMMSPFTSDYLAVGKLPALVQWTYLFTEAEWRDGDIIAPQDAVGADWIDEEDLVAVWEMYSAAIDCAEADLKLWANCENFTLANADSVLAGWLLRPASENIVSVPTTLDRFALQLDVASRYCENIITFSYNHYYSPEYVSSAYIDAYRDYVDNGYTVESEAPVMADIFTKTVTDEGIELNWSEAEDNIGISHYRILRNGEFIWRAETYDGYHRVSYTDSMGNIDDVYTIIAYDAAGNASAEITAE